MAASKIQSSPYSPIYPTNKNTGNLLVEVMGSTSSTPTPVVRTPSLLITSTSGSITTGAKSISIANSGNTAGTVLGSTFASGISVSWDAPYGDTLSAIAYDATGTTFVITEVR